jgi:hypothetical protein
MLRATPAGHDGGAAGERTRSTGIIYALITGATFGWLWPHQHKKEESVMRLLRYSINVTLDGCCDHRVMLADEDLHRHAVENLDQADALLFGRVTYEMMEAAFRPARTGARPDWMEPFARTIDAAKK